MPRLRLDLDELSVAEKLELIDELWVSLSVAPAAISLTESQVVELDARLDDLESHDPETVSWEQVRSQMTELGGSGKRT